MAKIISVLLVIMMAITGNGKTTEVESIGTPISKVIFNEVTEENIKMVEETCEGFQLNGVNTESELIEFYFTNEISAIILAFPPNGEQVEGDFYEIASACLASDSNIIFTILTDGENWRITAIG